MGAAAKVKVVAGVAAGEPANYRLSLTGMSFPLKLLFPSPMTDDQLLQFSMRNDTLRMERNALGEIEIMTPVGGEGSRWESYAIRELDLWAEEHGGVCFSSNAGFTLQDGSMLSPDVSWVAQQRWDRLTAKERQSFPPLCPDFLIEVRSASDPLRPLEVKMERWMGNGARLAWLIDPARGTLTIYRPGAEPEVLFAPESVEAGEPVAGFRLKTSRFWAR